MYGGSLAKLGEVLESVQRGIADVGFVVPPFEMSKLEPFNFPFWIPFTSGDVPMILRTATKTVNHFPLFPETLAKYNQRLIGDAYLTQTSYHLITTFPVKTMEDLKGKKIGHGGPMLPWLAALAATSVQATYNEVYTSIDTGVIDGYSMPANIVSGFKIFEVAKYFTEVNFCGTMAGFLTINLKTWNKLPKEVQDIMIEVGTEYSWDVVKRCLAIQKSAYNTMISNGVSIYKLPEKERARWAKRLNDARVAAKTIADAKKNGFAADKIAAYYIKTMEGEGYKFPYPPILTLK
jgi:TRAP-type C4-dicarboxylate transport system substrate-binding protein